VLLLCYPLNAFCCWANFYDTHSFFQVSKQDVIYITSTTIGIDKGKNSNNINNSNSSNNNNNNCCCCCCCNLLFSITSNYVLLTLYHSQTRGNGKERFLDYGIRLKMAKKSASSWF